jgi:hypothetical protein
MVSSNQMNATIKLGKVFCSMGIITKHNITEYINIIFGFYYRVPIVDERFIMLKARLKASRTPEELAVMTKM